MTAAGVDLHHRETTLVELMDDPACDLDELRLTYARFDVVNRLVSGWRRTWRARLRPLAVRARDEGRTLRLLDVGSGGGDVPRALARWAAREHLPVSVTAVDPDERAHAFATGRPTDGVAFRAASSADLVAEGERFDVVTSNHVLHHLGDAERAAVLADSERLATRLVLHGDIERGRLAWTGWWLGTLPVRRSFLRPDGLASIRRSFTADELRAVAPPGWTVERQAPARLLLVHRVPAAGSRSSAAADGAGSVPC